ncbi:MAG: ABC transporter permease subunit [Chlorobi bacterium]|nr:ABC transporter permease subunit [Chlorobiota bacterium]
MKLLLRIFKAELIKTNRTYGFTISVLIPVSISFLQFFVFYIKHEYFANVGMNPWEIMGYNLFNILGIIVMPMYIVLISYLINSTEHQSNSWKYLFALPIPKFKIYAVKILITLLWLFVFCVFTNTLFILTGKLLSYLRPDIGFQDFNINGLIFLSVLKLYLTGLGILSIQFFLSIYWKDFIRPVGIGLGLTIAALILSSWDYVYVIPYSHPLSVLMDFKELNTDFITRPVLFSVFYGLLFFLLGYYMVSKKEI